MDKVTSLCKDSKTTEYPIFVGTRGLLLGYRGGSLNLLYLSIFRFYEIFSCFLPDILY